MPLYTETSTTRNEARTFKWKNIHLFYLIRYLLLRSCILKYCFVWTATASY